ncbi:MAG: ketoacyl-ACP synthase III [Anaerolineales bacterium]|nr:ketoacyl-ACP synthase III [Anaerolineales bacterium]MCL4260476.1 ketoacyl-ACP synthase III [Anaerolineales bacterium]
MLNAHITGWGMAVPERVMTNDDLSEFIETNDAWIRERTGIRERRVARETDFTSTLAVDASMRALKKANIRPTDLDLIICSTSTPEYLFPATACLIQDQLGATKAGAFDLLAACSGFIYALNMGAQAIRSGSVKTVLVIGSETLSRFVNWKDRNTCILFGDGAGAFILQADERPGGVLSAVMHSDGSGGDLLKLPSGGSRRPISETTYQNGEHYIQMDGREVFRFATRVMASATQEALTAAGLTVQDVRWIVPHQANVRIIEAAARGLKLPMDRFIVNLDRYGNTSTASIPIAMVEAAEAGKIQRGDKVVMVGFGAGLTWGALAAEWTGPLPSKGAARPERYRQLGRIRSWVRRLIRFIEGLIYRREL